MDLGLSICRKIVAAHGGRMHASNHPHGGPCSTSSCHRAMPECISPRVFLVDDQPQVLKALARALSAGGFNPVTFTSAQAFLDSAHADDPGRLVLDLAMPGMDGMALQQALAARASLLPLVFLTGHGDLACGVAAMKYGAFDFLAKPVDVQRLLDVVMAALIVEGKLNKQVAAELGTVEKTVKAQRANLMHKTGADSVAALVRLRDAAHMR